MRLLAGNPMLLTVMALIAYGQDLPLRRYQLYEEWARILCHMWTVNKHLSDAGLRLEWLDYEDKEEMLGRVAFRIQGGGLAGNFIRKSELEEELKAYLRERHDVKAEEATRVARALIEELHGRNYILYHSGNGLYGFFNRSLLEWFVAVELARRLREDPAFSIEQLIDVAYARHWSDPAWNEVLRLVCGMVEVSHAGKIIEYLTRPTNDSHGDFAGRPPRFLVLAVQCLREVRQRKEIEAAGAGLLDAVRRVFEIPAAPRDLMKLRRMVREELLPAIREVGPNWPGSASWRAELETRFRLLANRALCGEYALVATHLFPEDPGVRDLLQRLATPVDPSLYSGRTLLFDPALLYDPALRRGVSEALASGWPGDDTVRAFLEDLARKDDHESVRSAVIEALAKNWPGDDRGSRLLMESSCEDVHESVRSLALELLARLWRHHSDVRKLLEKRAELDGSPLVRRTALEALAESWPNEPDVRDFLVSQARDDHFSVRSTALRALARGWQQEGAVVTLLEDRARHDRSDYVRGTVLEALAEVWPRSANVLALLEEKASADASAVVRATALDQMARGWPLERSVLDLLRERIERDGSAFARGAALGALAHSTLDSTAVVLLSKGGNGTSPFVDPWEAIASWRIDRCAEELRINPSELRCKIAGYSRQLGWDLLAGLRHH